MAILVCEAHLATGPQYTLAPPHLDPLWTLRLHSGSVPVVFSGRFYLPRIMYTTDASGRGALHCTDMQRSGSVCALIHYCMIGIVSTISSLHCTNTVCKNA